MMIFCDGFDRVARELETSELQLALHDGGRRDVWEGLSGVLEVGDVVLSEVVLFWFKAPNDSMLQTVWGHFNCQRAIMVRVFERCCSAFSSYG